MSGEIIVNIDPIIIANGTNKTKKWRESALRIIHKMVNPSFWTIPKAKHISKYKGRIRGYNGLLKL